MTLGGSSSSCLLFPSLVDRNCSWIRTYGRWVLDRLTDFLLVENWVGEPSIRSLLWLDLRKRSSYNFSIPSSFYFLWAFTFYPFILYYLMPLTFPFISMSSIPLSLPITMGLTTPTSRIEFDFDAIEEEDSPFPEVRASVSNIDDPDMPAMTIRMWFVGLLLCMTSRFVLWSLV